jgi:hypothetical protein
MAMEQLQEKNKSINMDQVNEEGAITLKDEVNNNNSNATSRSNVYVDNEAENHHHHQQRPTSYTETMMHLFKGNVGSFTQIYSILISHHNKSFVRNSFFSYTCSFVVFMIQVQDVSPWLMR